MPKSAPQPLIAYAHGIFEDSPDGGEVYWGWLVQDGTGQQIAEEYDCYATYVEVSQRGAEYEAVSGPVYWADEKGKTGLIIRTSHQAMIDFFTPGHQPTEEEIGRYGTEALEFFHAIGATIEYVAVEQNPAVALCQKAKGKKSETEVKDSQATANIVRKWMEDWPRVAEALEEMLERITDTGMDRERDWLNGGIVLQTGLSLESMQAIIRAYEDTYPVILGGGTDDDAAGEDDLWGAIDDDDDDGEEWGEDDDSPEDM